MSHLDTLRNLVSEASVDWLSQDEIDAITWAIDHATASTGSEQVGGVQWCVTHCGLNDETGENHTITELDADGDILEVYEDCCDLADLEDDGTFLPCDLRDLVALPKAVTE